MARSNECAQTVVPILKFLSVKEPAKNLSPKLHQVSEKALMPTKNLLLSCGQALKDCEIKWMPPNRCPHFEIFSMKKPSANNLAPKLHQVSEKALMHPKKLITVVWLSIKRWRDQKECAPTGVPISIFFKSGRRVNERRTNIIVSKTRTDNWKIRFNASLASCVSIENTHAPLLVEQLS